MCFRSRPVPDKAPALPLSPGCRLLTAGPLSIMIRNMLHSRNRQGNPGQAPGIGSICRLGLIVIPIIALFVVRKISDSDMWFHMAVGKQILATGSLPTTDRLSLLNFGRPIHAHLWLFQTLIAAGYPFAGAWWLLGVEVVLLILILCFVYRSCRVWASANAAWLLLLTVTIACSERFTVRPELVSLVMIALYYYRLQQGKYHAPAQIAVFFVLQEIWTNCHGIFVIGPFLTGCYLAESLLQGVRGKGYREARSLGILTAAVSAACVVTPNGWDNIQYAWRLFVESNPLAPKLSNATHEMAAALGEISRTMLPFWFYLFLIAAFLFGLLAIAIHCRRQIPLARTAIGCALLAASMTGMKNIPLFALVAAPLIAEYHGLLAGSRLRHGYRAAVVAAMAAAALVWSPRPALIFLKSWVPYRFGVGLSADYVPLGLPTFLDRTGFSGPIFNSMEQGGFYEYHGYPQRIAFYDSRLQDYQPEDIFAVYGAVTEAARNPGGWYALLQRYDFRGLLLGNSPDDKEAAGLLPLVAAQPGWRLVYLDHAASFWMRTDQGNLPPTLARGSVKNLVDGITAFAQAENIDFFLEKTGLYPELRLILLEKAAGQWESSIFLINLGLLKMQAGYTAEAEKLFTRVLKLKPDSRVTLTTLAQLALYRGDRAGAENYIRTALGYYPNDAELLRNLDTILTSR
jgi:hypothetical protein